MAGDEPRSADGGSYETGAAGPTTDALDKLDDNTASDPEQSPNDNELTEDADAIKTGTKRAAEDDAEGEAPKKSKVGRGRPKKNPGAEPATAADKKKKAPVGKKAAAAARKAKPASDEAEPVKKGRGRPRKDESTTTSTPKPKAPKKEKKPRAAANGAGVGSRTRSAKT